MNIGNLIHGSGGGSVPMPAAYAPVEHPDTLTSKMSARVMDILGEGPMGGLVDGMRSVYINRTPYVGGLDDKGEPILNFKEVTFYFRNGTSNQAALSGEFSQIENEVNDGNVEVKYGEPYIIGINDPSYTHCRVNIRIPNLTQQTEKGDLTGAHTVFKITGRAGGVGPFIPIGSDTGMHTINGKSTAVYVRSYLFDLANTLGPGPWEIKIERSIPDSTSVKLQDKFYIMSHTLIRSYRLRYPNTCYAAMQANAVSFNAVPSRSYLVYGLIVQVPSNYTPRSYNPATKTWTPASYAGDWDGTFKPAWTDNPAWCLYDLLTQERYGLGRYISAEQVDKWALYDVARYCDEMVPDGFGGTEPRYTCNVVLGSREQAFKVVQAFASIFRGMAYWAAGQIYTLTDRPTDPVALFTEAKVIDGVFTYSSAAERARHNMVMVAWNDPSNHYEQAVEYVENAADIAERGAIFESQIVAFGCTSRGQAHRAGRRILYTEALESDMVTFRVVLESLLVSPGDIVQVQDQSRANKRFGGIVLDCTTTQVQIDAPVTLEAGKSYTLWVMLPDGTPVSRPINNAKPYTGTLIEVDELPQAPSRQASWTISASDLQPTTWRVLSIRQSTSTEAEITALRHDPAKYYAIEQSLELDLPPLGGSGLIRVVDPVKNITVTESTYIASTGVRTRVMVGWEGAPFTAKYILDYRIGDGDYHRLPEMTQPSAVLDDAVPGDYQFRVYAVAPSGIITVATLASATILGKTAAASNVTGFTATPSLTSVELAWVPVADLDLDSYEIRSGASWDAGTAIVSGLKATKFTWQRPGAGAYTLWIKAKDTSGNYSDTATQATMTVVADDDLLAPSEKQEFKGWYDRIKAEQSALVTAAAAFGVSSTSYTTAISTIESQLEGTGEWSAGTWTSYATVTSLGAGGGATLRANRSAVDQQRDALISAIQAAEVGYVEGLTSASYNLIKNGTSEEPNPQGYRAAGVADIGASAYAGTKVRRISRAGSYGALYVEWDLPCSPGEQFFLQAMARNTSGGGNVRCGFRFYDETDTVLGWESSSQTHTSTSWTAISAVGTAPAGTTKMGIYLASEGSAGPAVADFDALYACRKIAAGMLEADLAVAGVVRSPNYVAGANGSAPEGYKLSGAPFTSTLKDGTTMSAQAEFGENINIAGQRALAIANAALGNFQEWTSPGSYNWTCPDGVTSIELTLVGGGGGGEAGTTNTRGGGGGGGGGTVSYEQTVTPGTTYTVIVGTFGVGGDTSGEAGTSGGASQFKEGSTVVAYANGGNGGSSGTGGNGGAAGTPSLARTAVSGGALSATAGLPGTDCSPIQRPRTGTICSGAGGGGGCSSVNYQGGDGGDGPALSGTIGGSGGGPNSLVRAGGGGGASADGNGASMGSTAPSSSLQVGGGGGGGNSLSDSFASGGDGAPGYASIRW